MILRDYRLEDFPRLCEIDRLCFPPGIAYTAREMHLFLADRRAFALIAEEPGPGIVGFVIARLEVERELSRRAFFRSPKARVGHIVTLDVHPDWQGRGIGSLLLQEAERRLRRAGARAILLETAVDNARAIRFYQKHGYAVLARLKGYYLGETDAFLMRKSVEANQSPS